MCRWLAYTGSPIYLALSFGLEDDPPGAVARAIGFVEAAGRKRGATYPFQGTIATSNGEDLWAFRYSTEGTSRSLFFSRDVRAVRQLYRRGPSSGRKSRPCGGPLQVTEPA